MSQRYENRREGGVTLAKELHAYAGVRNLLVVGLLRGGVPVAYEVARALRAPLDIFVARKIGFPGYEELAMGAVAAGGIRLVDWDMVRTLGVSQASLESAIRKAEQEVARRERTYRGERARLAVTGRTVIAVDDGVATGATMRVAIAALRQQAPERIVAAVPIASPATCNELSELADEVVCAATPEPFQSVGLWYEDFRQMSDDEVRDLLARAAREHEQERSAARGLPQRAS